MRKPRSRNVRKLIQSHGALIEKRWHVTPGSLLPEALLLIPVLSYLIILSVNIWSYFKKYTEYYAMHKECINKVLVVSVLRVFNLVRKTG